MRLLALPWILLLPTVAFPQESTPEPSPYAAMGFPVTFNDEIITAHDVARLLGDLPLEEIDPRTLMRARDQMLFRKISERIAADLSIEVRPQAVEDLIRREIDGRGGDAKFYEYLAQQGTTLERYRIEKRQWILDQLLRFLLTNGISYDRTQLLPWRVNPTPKEIETAIRNDPERRGHGARVRRLTLTVDATQETRSALAVKQMRKKGMTPEEVAAELEAAIRPRVEACLEALKHRAFADVASEYGTENIELMAQEWVPLGNSTDAEKFLATAEPGTWSKPLPKPGGAYEIVYLIEREEAGERKASDPAVSEEYSRRIRTLRATKWEWFLRLRALNESTVEPQRVRDDLRKLILDSLREAEQALNALGLK